MNICIDQGNSRTKVALFNAEGKMVKHFVYKTFTSTDAERLFALYPIKNSIISSVVNLESSMINALNRLSQHFVLFDYQTPVPIQNDYSTPETLGQDRLAAAVGASWLCPNENLLIIDAGSAVTYDFVSEEGHFLGGNIAPGLKMRLTVLHTMTKKLPLVDVDEQELIPLYGQKTRDAIAAGVVRGMVFEVKGYIRTMAERTKHFRAFLTGGHAPYIYGAVQNDVQYEKQLVLIGLNRILEFNNNK
ncbi:MAG: type III pantothenate kinase [Paludibacteraceae bacterium]|nr:type III pantothenate kinase [Paludibacteraceae bacterium]